MQAESSRRLGLKLQPRQRDPSSIFWLVAAIGILSLTAALCIANAGPASASAITRQSLGGRQVASSTSSVALNKTNGALSSSASIGQVAALLAAKPRASLAPAPARTSAGKQLQQRTDKPTSGHQQTVASSASNLSASVRLPRAEQQVPPSSSPNPVRQQGLAPGGASVRVNSQAGRKLARMQTKRQTDSSLGDLNSGPLTSPTNRRNEDPWFLDQAPYPLQPYRFNYNVKARDGSTEQYRQEVGDGKFLTGSYGYVLPDGIYRHVDYVADDRGFRAFIRTSEPGTANQNPADVVIQANPLTSLSPGVSYATGSFPSSSFPAASPASSGQFSSSFPSAGGSGLSSSFGSDTGGSVARNLLQSQQQTSLTPTLPRRAPGSIVGTPLRNFTSLTFGLNPNPLPPSQFDSIQPLDPTIARLRATSLLGPPTSSSHPGDHLQGPQFRSIGVADGISGRSNLSMGKTSLQSNYPHQQQQVDPSDTDQPSFFNRVKTSQQQLQGSLKGANAGAGQQVAANYNQRTNLGDFKPSDDQSSPLTRGDDGDPARFRHQALVSQFQPLRYQPIEPRSRSPWVPIGGVPVMRTGPDVLAYDRPFGSLASGGIYKLHYDNNHILHPDPSAPYLALERARNLAQLERLNAANNLFGPNRKLGLHLTSLGTLQPLGGSFGGGESSVSGKSEQHRHWEHKSSKQIVDDVNKVTLTSHQASGSSSGSGREFGLVSGLTDEPRRDEPGQRPPPQPVFHHQQHADGATKGQRHGSRLRVAPYATSQFAGASQADLGHQAETKGGHSQPTEHASQQFDRALPGEPSGPSSVSPRGPDEPRTSPAGEPTSPRPPMPPQEPQPPQPPQSSSPPAGQPTSAEPGDSASRTSAGVKGAPVEHVRNTRMPDELRGPNFMLMNDLRAMQNVIGLPQPPRPQRSALARDSELRGLNLAEQMVSARMRRVDGLLASAGRAPAPVETGGSMQSSDRPPATGQSTASSSTSLVAAVAVGPVQQMAGGAQIVNNQSRAGESSGAGAGQELLASGRLLDNQIQLDDSAKPTKHSHGDPRHRLSLGTIVLDGKPAIGANKLTSTGLDAKKTSGQARVEPEPTLSPQLSTANFEAQRLNQSQRTRLQAEKVSELEKFQQRLRTQQLLLEQVKSSGASDHPRAASQQLIGDKLRPTLLSSLIGNQNHAIGAQQAANSSLDRPNILSAPTGQAQANETQALAELNSQVKYDDQLEAKLAVSQFNRLRRQNEAPTQQVTGSDTRSEGHNLTTGAEESIKRLDPRQDHQQPKPRQQHQRVGSAMGETSPNSRISKPDRASPVGTQSQPRPFKLQPTEPAGSVENSIDTLASKSSGPNATRPVTTKPAEEISRGALNAGQPANTINLDFINSVTALSVDQLNPFAIASVNPGVQQQRLTPHRLGQLGATNEPAEQTSGLAISPARYRNPAELVALAAHRQQQADEQQNQQQVPRTTDGLWPPSNHRLDSSSPDLSQADASRANQRAPYAVPDRQQTKHQPRADITSSAIPSNEPPGSKTLVAESSRDLVLRNESPVAASPRLTSREQVLASHRQLASELNLHQRDGFDVRNRSIQVVDNHRFFEVVSGGADGRHLPAGDSSAAFQAFRGSGIRLTPFTSLVKCELNPHIQMPNYQSRPSTNGGGANETELMSNRCNNSIMVAKGKQLPTQARIESS